MNKSHIDPEDLIYGKGSKIKDMIENLQYHQKIDKTKFVFASDPMGLDSNYGAWPAGEKAKHNTYCRSNYDFFGNERFSDQYVMESGVFVEDLAFGVTRFNTLPTAFVTIFQCITEEGWTDVMYQIMDGWMPGPGAVYFVLLIMVGSFFCLNLTLAVIWSEFSKADEAREATEQIEEHTSELQSP